MKQAVQYFVKRLQVAVTAKGTARVAPSNPPGISHLGSLKPLELPCSLASHACRQAGKAVNWLDALHQFLDCCRSPALPVLHCCCACLPLSPKLPRRGLAAAREGPTKSALAGWPLHNQFPETCLGRGRQLISLTDGYFLRGAVIGHALSSAWSAGLGSQQQVFDWCPRGASRGMAGFPGLTQWGAPQPCWQQRRQSACLEVSLLPDLHSGEFEQRSMF